MALDFRFAIIGDPHIGLPHTIWDNPSRFHLIEVSIPALEIALEHIDQWGVDFLLIPGDLTQHGEAENHRWLAERLGQLPFPTYVVPGNHDIVQREADGQRIGLQEFPQYYRNCGYGDGDRSYYHQEILPGVHLIGLNSNQFDADGQLQRRGSIDGEQLHWLHHTLKDCGDQLVLLMVHHNVLEHLPDQGQHLLGQRYLLANSADLLAALPTGRVPLIFTGHLHVQDLAQSPNTDPCRWELTTGSLVSYPHPYRLCQFHQDPTGQCHLAIQSPRITGVEQWPNLQDQSRQWMADRSPAFMARLLMSPPLNLSETEAQPLIPDLRYFWSQVANGNPTFDFSHFPEPARSFFQRFSDTDGDRLNDHLNDRLNDRLNDNEATVIFHHPHPCPAKP